MFAFNMCSQRYRLKVPVMRHIKADKPTSLPIYPALRRYTALLFWAEGRVSFPQSKCIPGSHLQGRGRLWQHVQWISAI